MISGALTHRAASATPTGRHGVTVLAFQSCDTTQPRIMSTTSLLNGLVLGPDGDLTAGDLHVAGGLITDDAPASGQQIDCGGLYVLPGLIDVHGDQFEREFHPRPGVDIPMPVAMRAVDRMLVANGITTAFHGLTLSWEPGQRSLGAGRRFMAGLDAARGSLIADHRVQLRWETFAFDAVGDLEGWLGAESRPALAFNDHTTATLEKVAAGTHAKLAQWAARAGVTAEDYLGLVEDAAERAADVPVMVAEVASLAARRGAVMLTHDLKCPEEQERLRRLGVSVCEFPLTEAAARDAVAHGEDIVLGAPNVVRGGSHTGALRAEDAIRDGLCTVLASDYYYPAMLAAVGGLVARGVTSRAEAWALVSSNAARAMRLGDRGRIAPGLRGDVVVVDWSEAEHPIVKAVITGGTLTRIGW